MKKLFLTLSLVAASSFLYKCTQVEYVEAPRVEPVFSEQAQEWGELFAETLTATVKQVKKQKISLDDQNAVFSVSEHVTWSALEQKGLVTANDRVSYANARTISVAAEPVSLAQSLESEELTDAQKDVLKQIEEVRPGSGSYIEFSNRLATINNEISSVVPEEEQTLLYSVASSLYYGLEAMNELVKQAILLGAPEQGNITLAHLKLGFPSVIASGESGSCGGWWSCWGKCATGTIGGATAGAVAGGEFGLKIGTLLANPIKGAIIGATGGAIGGGIGGVAAGC